MQTISANDYLMSHCAFDKMPHTGPVYYGIGRNPYSAVYKGRTLKRKDRKDRLFKTADAAIAAIRAHAETETN